VPGVTSYTPIQGEIPDLPHAPQYGVVVLAARTPEQAQGLGKVERGKRGASSERMRVCGDRPGRRSAGTRRAASRRWWRTWRRSRGTAGRAGRGTRRWRACCRCAGRWCAGRAGRVRSRAGGVPRAALAAAAGAHARRRAEPADPAAALPAGPPRDGGGAARALGGAGPARLPAEQGVTVDPPTIYARVQEFAALHEDAARPCRRAVGACWSADETCDTVTGTPGYISRAIDRQSQMVAVYVSERRATGGRGDVLLPRDRGHRRRGHLPAHAGRGAPARGARDGEAGAAAHRAGPPAPERPATAVARLRDARRGAPGPPPCATPASSSMISGDWATAWLSGRRCRHGPP
jgi:hypothetical protein